jgi:replicative DNA helicase
MNTHGEELKIEFDAVGEQVVLAAAMVDDGARANLVAHLLPDHFQAKEHRAAWTAMRELVRRGMGFDLATLQKLGGIEQNDINYLQQLIANRPMLPPNLAYHVEMLLWDHARITTACGPLATLLKELHDPKADPERVKSVSRQVTETLNNHREHKYLRDPDALIAERISEIRARRDGLALYTYGIEGLDFFQERDDDGTPKRRMIPGPAPGQITAVIGVPGGGKSTVACRMTLGFARQGRKVLYCAWEMNAGTSLELMACMSLGWSRSRIQQGKSPARLDLLNEEEFDIIRERMTIMSPYIRFLENPFYRRTADKASNERNLDILQGYIAESGCDVVVCDLWKRCLVYTKPEDEEKALIRQQVMAEETKTHIVLVQQLRLKDVEQREDKHPTREGIKGSGAWTEVPDTIIGVHRPALWKAIDDNVIELDVLKQRFGRFPLAVEFDWDGDKGGIDGGRSVDYSHPGSGESESTVTTFFKKHGK